MNVQLQTINKIIINIKISVYFERRVSSSHSNNLTVISELHVPFRNSISLTSCHNISSRADWYMYIPDLFVIYWKDAYYKKEASNDTFLNIPSQFFKNLIFSILGQIFIIDLNVKKN